MKHILEAILFIDSKTKATTSEKITGQIWVIG